MTSDHILIDIHPKCLVLRLIFCPMIRNNFNAHNGAKFLVFFPLPHWDVLTLEDFDFPNLLRPFWLHQCAQPRLQNFQAEVGPACWYAWAATAGLGGPFKVRRSVCLLHLLVAFSCDRNQHSPSSRWLALYYLSTISLSISFTTSRSYNTTGVCHNSLSDRENLTSHGFVQQGQLPSCFSSTVCFFLISNLIDLVPIPVTTFDREVCDQRFLLFSFLFEAADQERFTGRAHLGISLSTSYRLLVSSTMIASQASRWSFAKVLFLLVRTSFIRSLIVAGTTDEFFERIVILLLLTLCWYFLLRLYLDNNYFQDRIIRYRPIGHMLMGCC